MLNTIKTTVQQESLVSITCDKCKRDFLADDFLEVQEFHHIRFTAGYGSVFGDGDTITADICQRCLKELIGGFCVYNDR